MTAIILDSPQMGENIGAVARVMHNFALSDLRIVTPRDGWPNQKAVDMAAGGAEIIHNAKIFDSIEEAIADLNYVYAATARSRDMVKETVSPAEIELVGKTGFLFGRESSGLSNHAIMLSSKIVTIPVNPEYSSINIAMSAGIICYEISKLKLPPAAEEGFATKDEVAGFIKHVETELDKTNFFSVARKKPGMMINFSNIFTRMKLTSQEVRTLRGIIRCLSEK